MAGKAFLEEDQLASRIAHEAGALLLKIQSREADGKARGAEGDRASNSFIIEELRRACPNDAILSEESPDERTRLVAERLWIVDPLDGTREFGEGRVDWAVHVAFLYKNELQAGAVALPSRGLTLSATATKQIRQSKRDRLRIMVSRTRAPAIAQEVADALGGELVEMGSAGYKAMSVVLAEAEAYIHAGGQYEWDLAAPAAVALSAGLHVSRLDGSPLRFNQPSTWMPDVLICHRELASRILPLLGS